MANTAPLFTLSPPFSGEALSWSQQASVQFDWAGGGACLGVQSKELLVHLI
jgi:hypothetical protein